MLGVDTTVDEILERTVSYYESVLWDAPAGHTARARLPGAGFDPEPVRAFGVGYAPGTWEQLLDYLAQWGYSADELAAAGIATPSGRGRLHVHFRSRVMFPVRESGGRMLGFAGMATHPGPSWPLWLTSPESARYRKGAALFGIERAAESIRRTGTAIVLGDCLDVIRMHADGRAEAVAAIRSAVTMDHLAALAAELDADPADLGVERGDEGVTVTRLGGDRGGAGDALDASRPALVSPRGAGAGAPASGRAPSAGGAAARSLRALPYLASALVGIAIPLGWFWLLGPESNEPNGNTAAFVRTVAAMAGTYLGLTILAAFVSARLRVRAAGRRRMRQPWERGATEWQPTAWTYHQLEDLLIAAALVSVVASMVLFVTVGGFAA